MTKFDSLMAGQIERSKALIAEVLPIIEVIRRAADGRKIRDPMMVLRLSVAWRKGLIGAQAKLDRSALTLALLERTPQIDAEIKELAALRTELADLIDTIGQLTAAFLKLQICR